MAASEDLHNAPAAGATPNLEEKQQDLKPEQTESFTAEEKIPIPYPAHPIPQLQGPFEESILETNEVSTSEWVVDIDPQTRRRDLLENDEYERLCGRRWRQRATERYHPFWKLVSQMVFGVHLLANRLSKSEPQVMKILQSHVDEVDGFLQRTTEDFLIIHLDVRTRIQYLNLPLGNLEVFDQMLEDRNFRLSLVSYNDQIEHAIFRFTLAITDAVKDLRKCKEAMSALWHYLHQLDEHNCFESDSLSAFYRAMMENIEGWLSAVSKLRRRGAALQKALSQLTFAVTEMQQRVGVASRKDVADHVPTANKDNADSSAKTAPRSGSIMPKPIDRSKSCDALATEANAGASIPSRTPGKLSRKLSKPFLHKRAASEKVNISQNRPASAPARVLKSRSVSMEQLRTLWANGRPRTQQSMMKPPIQPQQSEPQQPEPLQPEPPQASQQQSDCRERMKSQISHFLKTDRVVEAWDNMANKPSFGRNRARTRKDWPCSIFRAKPSDKSRARPEKESGLAGSGADLEKQMSWVQDTPEYLNTYSFKQRPEASPRIHVLSVQMNLDEDTRVAQEGVRKTPDVNDDTSSTITALPAVPPPTPTTIRSMVTLHKPRTVECAQG
ncbi:uncharacterized protein N7459_005166 [Penicillium hispanicum]|uniref:uncharacterized protein n=1 Tax=Penicillium hispanicum TaxID=1080232 RepID=UPI00253F77AE|nr:uncharacterized protein N7459_005166 [Penicillium hispanicum]KAJ5585366.1 hypothetical protein N7459_005166 [Penicillium hispanicum]